MIAVAASAGPSFAVEVEADGGGGRRFWIRGANPAGEPCERRYELRHPSHAEYLRLFEALSGDFGTRRPAARAPPPAAAASPGLRPLITDNLVPEILYGYGDPAVLRVETGAASAATYYVVVTSNDAPDSFPILSSTDLIGWAVEGFAFRSGAKPPWAARDGEGDEYWAPELHKVGDRYLLCFAARRPDGELCIGLATSTAPAGPFKPEPAPILTGGVIDPHVHVGADGAVTLYWKQDSNDRWPGLLATILHRRPEMAERLFESEPDGRTARFLGRLWPWIETLGPMERFLALQTLIEAVLDDFAEVRARLAGVAADPQLAALAVETEAAMRTRIFGQPLDPAGWRLVGEPVLVLENDLEWEGHLVEGVWVWTEGERHYIFYSANDFSTVKYGVGVGVGPTPLGPFVKQREPLLRSTDRWWGLGHPSVARGPDGRARLFLHGFRPGHVGYKEFRALLEVPLAFEGDRVAAGG